MHSLGFYVTTVAMKTCLGKALYLMLCSRSALQFLIGSAHVRKQPPFMRACERAFDSLCIDGSTCFTTEKFRDIIRAAISTLSEESVDQLVHLFDVDKDGKIDRDDFLRCLWKNPLLVALFPQPNDDIVLTVHA
ncbi:hypothetical protein HPP92_012965 [Vanilla planifolia]|uniref:EF-hand domain-containing protein n=1 Tax=Vanilla planifolia TaxID=51239 RepID=A0A835UUD4_VANPL|nr:hypothetical protein HPP92_012965 [Vanilla planifolia]